jgi:hypothetical protein
MYHLSEYDVLKDVSFPHLQFTEQFEPELWENFQPQSFKMLFYHSPPLLQFSNVYTIPSIS